MDILHLSTASYFLGIDGGGTKTLAIIIDANRRELARGFAGSSNYASVGFEVAIRNIFQAVGAAYEALGERVVFEKAWLGLAGLDTPQDFLNLHPHLASLARVVHLTNDAELILSALEQAVGVALIAGTGSIALGRNEEGVTGRAGGWGYLLGDEGSGYDLGRKALLAAVRAADGRDVPTLLLDLVLAQWQLQSAEDLIGKVYQTSSNQKSLIASLSGCVFKAARQGDSLAQSILSDASTELALAVTTTANLIFPPEQAISLALTGGILLSESVFREQVIAHVRAIRPIKTIACVEEPALCAAQAVLDLRLEHWHHA